jgi:hypothetical protein
VEDAIRLEAVADLDPDSTIETILQELTSGTLEAWRVVGTNVIVMTRTCLFSKRPFLHIEAVIGVGLKSVIGDVVADLKKLAKDRGCGRLTAVTSRKGWARATEKLGFSPVSINYEMELSDGREAS